MAQERAARIIEQEHWLRANGLPLVVPPARRLRGLVPRTVPLLVTFALLATGLVMADAAISNDEVIDLIDIAYQPTALAALIVAAVVTLLAIPLGIGYAVLQRRLASSARLIAGSIVIAFWLLGLSLLPAITHAQIGLHLGIEERVGLLLVAGFIGYFGLGDMARWAGRRGARELAATFPAIARILPLLLLTVLLVFFTNELWQLAGTMPKARMNLLAAFLVLMIVLIVLPATFDMIDDELDDDEAEEYLLTQTPFQGVAPTRSKLSLGERFNLIAVSLAVQFVQILLFVVVTFGVFAAFGSISLTNELIATWTGRPPKQLVVVGIRLPMEAHMFRVCMILALFSGITFAASMLQDERYRKMFLTPVSEEVQRNLAARHRYRATLAGQEHTS